MLNILTTIVAFIVVFAIVVIVHEFGHFWVARRMGVRVLRFSIGFGSTFWRKVDKYGTEYVISAIPLGGYVKMLDGREQTLIEEEKPFAFDLKPVSKRFAIVIAGPVFNFLFAILAYAVLLMVGVQKVAPIIADVMENSAAANAGIKIGDEIIAIDHHETNDWQSVYFAILQRTGEAGTVNLQVRQFPQGPEREYELPLNKPQGQQPDPLTDLGITLGLPFIPSIIDEVVPGQPADMAGLKSGDEVTSLNGKPIKNWYDLVDHIRNNTGQPVHLTVKRADHTFDTVVTPKLEEIEGAKVGMIGIRIKQPEWPPELLHIQREWPLAAFSKATVYTWDLSVLTLDIMGKMITGKVALENLTGPISIARGAQESATSGWMQFVSFLILLSVNLGVINLLPIPMLDGGHLLYYVIEWIRGKPVSDATQRIGFFIGLLIIIGLMLVGLHNDLMSFW
jgi:regulator of sigma E protease